MKNRISFVIPSYNCENTLKESVDSIFNKNFNTEDEVIIINDASTDNTEKVAQELAVFYYPKIKIIKNEQNKGCPASRNIAISQAKNELIFNLDSDNILTPRSIEKLKEQLIIQKADMCAFQKYYYFKTDTSKVTHKWICKTGFMSLPDFFSGYINPGPGGNFLFKKEIWNKVGGYWEYGKGLHEAWGFTFKMLVNGAKFYVVEDTYYYHRYSHSSLFVRESSKKEYEQEITNLFIKDYMNIFDISTRNFILKNNDWFKKINNFDFIIDGKTKGKDGKLVYTNIFKELVNKIKKCIR